MRTLTPARLLTVAAALTLGLQAASAQANWPERPLHLIVPFPAGSSSDIVARVVAQSLGDRLHQTIVVENRAGASGNLGSEAVARADPDGYTLGLGNTGTMTLPQSLLLKPTYDARKDFAAISMIGASPFVLASYPGLPARTVQELIALARSKPGAVTVATAGPATLANLAGVLFAKMASIDLTPVSYRGSEQEVVDVIAGRVDMQVATIPPTLQLIRDGKVRAIAVTGARRSPVLPDVPTVAEAGVPGYESVLWQALYAPAGTPAATVARLNTETSAALHDPAVIAALAKLGVEAEASTAQELAARIASDMAKWHDVIVTAGIKPQ